VDVPPDPCPKLLADPRLEGVAGPQPASSTSRQTAAHAVSQAVMRGASGNRKAMCEVNLSRGVRMTEATG
jgi:hypothetical protein